MHPGFIHHWRRRRASEGQAAYYGCYGGGSGLRWDASRRFGEAGVGAAGFGARRPVRFLALRLDLDDAQVAKLAKIVERLRVEREQAAVDSRRAAGVIADALERAEIEAARVEEATRLRVDATRRVQESVARALAELHALLDAEQREELASLIRSGEIQL
jgi:Spy/CpxP family protein refolding chaperone